MSICPSGLRTKLCGHTLASSVTISDLQRIAPIFNELHPHATIFGAHVLICTAGDFTATNQAAIADFLRDAQTHPAVTSRNGAVLMYTAIDFFQELVSIGCSIFERAPRDPRLCETLLTRAHWPTLQVFAVEEQVRSVILNFQNLIRHHIYL